MVTVEGLLLLLSSFCLRDARFLAGRVMSSSGMFVRRLMLVCHAALDDWCIDEGGGCRCRCGA